MKNLITILTILVIGLAACTENSDFITQDSGSDNLSLEKKHKDKGKDKDAPPQEYYTFSQMVDGKKGAKIKFKVSMDKSTGQKSEVKLDIPKGAFEGEQEISFYITAKEPSIVFSPHGLEFKKKVKLELKLENFWFEKEDENKIDFIYADEFGNFLEEVKYDKVEFKYNKNFVKVKKAELEHFSRYMFSR